MRLSTLGCVRTVYPALVERKETGWPVTEHMSPSSAQGHEGFAQWGRLRARGEDGFLPQIGEGRAAGVTRSHDWNALTARPSVSRRTVMAVTRS